MQDSPVPTGQMKYFAFLSYAHKDAQAAAALGRYIETFRVPVRLGGKEQNLPKRMFPVFRDREEFSASSDLGAAIEDALTKSGALVVLCSPNAAQSKWVNEEIRTFRRTSSPRRIFCVLLEGEPSEAFPAALIAGNVEPLAVDFRRGGDNQRDARLRLVAALLGVEFDALKRRERIRKRNARTRITGLTALVSATLLFASFRVTSLQHQQRVVAEAEQLADASIQKAPEEGAPDEQVTGALQAAQAYAMADTPRTEGAVLTQLIISGTGNTEYLNAAPSTHGVLLGLWDAPTWPDSYALGDHTLFLEGPGGIRSYDLNADQTGLHDSSDASQSTRIRDVGDGIHAVSLNYQTGEIKLMDIASRPRTISSFHVSWLTAGNPYRQNGAQIAFDPITRVITVATDLGIHVFSADGHELLRRRLGWGQFALHGVPSPYPPGEHGSGSEGVVYLLSGRGNYVIFRSTFAAAPDVDLGDWLLTSNAQLVAKFGEVRVLQRDDYAVGSSEALAAYKVYRLPSMQPEPLLPLGGAKTSTIAVSPNHRFLAYVAEGGSNVNLVRLLDIATRTTLPAALPFAQNDYPGDRRFFIEYMQFTSNSRDLLVAYRVEQSLSDMNPKQYLAVYSADPKTWEDSLCVNTRRQLDENPFGLMTRGEVAAGRAMFHKNGACSSVPKP